MRFFFILFACLQISWAGDRVPASTPKSADATIYRLQAENLAVVVNDADRTSVAVADYYRQQRHIPEKNIVHVRIDNAQARLSVAAFVALKREIEEQLTPDIQAIVLVWTAPYAVECNSITSALTLGYLPDQCKQTCAPGKPSPYFNSASVQPYRDFHIRPSMLLPTESFEQAKDLIDRGVLSSRQKISASAYFLETSDHNRSSRARLFPPSGFFPRKKLTVHTLRQDDIENVSDIMVYETGLANVDKLETLHFMPGALADHLTSFGGDLYTKGQMSSLRWLDAGATASYGTVSEPCNYWQKFPHPVVLLEHYLSGDTALEAYWKSVAWPAQGVFIGEPLASPYREASLSVPGSK